MEGTEKSESSYYLRSYWDTLPSYYVVAMEKVAEKHLLAKCFKYNTFSSY